MNLHHLLINKSWTLFLDRDGVINRLRENDYVKSWSEFEFLPGVLESIAGLSQLFGRIIVVTNQQGIGKGLYTVNDLEQIHQKMISEINAFDGRIDKVYFAPALDKEDSPLRKPKTGMAELAVSDFPEINLSQSIIVGDSITDMDFGKRTGMKTVFVGGKNVNETEKKLIDFNLKDLLDFWHSLKS
jgi:histidinol-phosphate phosphatase family protein